MAVKADHARMRFVVLIWQFSQEPWSIAEAWVSNGHVYSPSAISATTFRGPAICRSSPAAHALIKFLVCVIWWWGAGIATEGGAGGVAACAKKGKTNPITWSVLNDLAFSVGRSATRLMMVQPASRQGVVDGA
jgi:hypothetical protein